MRSPISRVGQAFADVSKILRSWSVRASSTASWAGARSRCMSAAVAERHAGRRRRLSPGRARRRPTFVASPRSAVTVHRDRPTGSPPAARGSGRSSASSSTRRPYAWRSTVSQQGWPTSPRRPSRTVTCTHRRRWPGGGEGDRDPCLPRLTSAARSYVSGIPGPALRWGELQDPGRQLGTGFRRAALELR